MPNFFEQYAETEQGRNILRESLEEAQNSLERANHLLQQARNEYTDATNEPVAYGDRAEHAMLLQSLHSQIDRLSADVDSLNNSIKELSSALSHTPNP